MSKDKPRINIPLSTIVVTSVVGLILWVGIIKFISVVIR